MNTWPFYTRTPAYFGGGPSIPPTPPPPPMLQQPNITAAGARQRTAGMGAGGQGSTLKTGTEGLPGPAQTAQKTLLGG